MTAHIMQIPLDVLGDNIGVTEHVSATKYPAPPEQPVHAFNHVRVQSADTSITSGGAGVGGQLQHLGNYLVFIDAVNSENVDGYQIKVDDAVTWDGKPRKVVQVAPCVQYGGVVHHWEVTLN